jgi:hypothetical protein
MSAEDCLKNFEILKNSKDAQKAIEKYWYHENSSSPKWTAKSTWEESNYQDLLPKNINKVPRNLLKMFMWTAFYTPYKDAPKELHTVEATSWESAGRSLSRMATHLEGYKPVFTKSPGPREMLWSHTESQYHFHYYPGNDNNLKWHIRRDTGKASLFQRATYEQDNINVWYNQSARNKNLQSEYNTVSKIRTQMITYFRLKGDALEDLLSFYQILNKFQNKATIVWDNL